MITTVLPPRRKSRLTRGGFFLIIANVVNVGCSCAYATLVDPGDAAWEQLLSQLHEWAGDFEELAPTIMLANSYR